MKIGVIGAGRVGAACVLSLVLRASADEVMLIDRTRKRAEAVVADISYAIPLLRHVVLTAGGYDDLAGAQLVMVTAGENEKSGGATDRNDKEGRLKLLDKNAEIYGEMVPRIVKAAPDAVILVVTDPPDPLADVTRRLAGHDRVLSTGTWLDSLRLRTHIAAKLAISPETVEAQILGEHGTSEVFVWSSARVAGSPLDRVLADRQIEPKAFREETEKEVRFANISIIEGNEASQYGIAVVSARIAEAVLRDERIATPVGAYNAEYGVTLSLPGILGRRGVERWLTPDLSEEERRKLEASVGALRKAADRVNR